MNKNIDLNDDAAGNGWDDADSGLDVHGEASRQAYLEDRDDWLRSRVAHHADGVPF